MESKDNSHRKNLASMFDVELKTFDHFSDDLVYFLNYEFFGGSKRFILKFDSSSPRIIFKKAKWIRDYFKVTKEKNADYNGKIKMGKLSLTSEQFENYISKKIKSSIYLIF